MRSCNAAELAAAATVGNKDAAASLGRCRCRNSWRKGRRNGVESQSSALTLLCREPKYQNNQQFITKCRTRHLCRSITMFSITSTTVMVHMPKLRPWNNDPKSRNLPLPQQSAPRTPQRLHGESMYPQSTSRARKPARVTTFQPSGVCRVAFCKMFSSGRKLCRVSGLAQVSKIRVSTFEGLSSCPKEHTFIRNNPAESQDSCRFQVYAIAPRERESPRKPLQSFRKGLETALRGLS